MTDPDKVIKTDSSNTGCGGIIDGTSVKTGGFWSYEEQQNHIFFLELKAAFLSLKRLLSNENDIHVKLLMDNSVAVKIWR